MAASTPADAAVAAAPPHVVEPAVTLRGEVVHGFKRGSKELGIPTANLCAEALKDHLETMPTGVYYGWASVGASDRVYKMVMSVGWNPFYKNEKKTVEPHLLHEFPEDFYGEELRLVVTGFIRPELNFSSLDALIAAIKADIAHAQEHLDAEPHAALATHEALKPAAATAAAATAAAAAPATGSA